MHGLSTIHHLNEIATVDALERRRQQQAGSKATADERKEEFPAPIPCHPFLPTNEKEQAE